MSGWCLAVSVCESSRKREKKTSYLNLNSP